MPGPDWRLLVVASAITGHSENWERDRHSVETNTYTQSGNSTLQKDNSVDWGVLCKEVHPGGVPKAKLELAEPVREQQGEATAKP